MTEGELIVWFHVYGFYAVLAIVIAITVAWVVYDYRTPREAKQIRKATRKKQPINCRVNDVGQAEFEPIVKVSASGAIATTRNRTNKKRWLGFLPRKSNQAFFNPFGPEAEGIATDNASKYVEGLASSKVILKDAKIPIVFSYSGKAIATSLQMLAGVELANRIALDGGVPLVENTPNNGMEPFKCEYCGATGMRKYLGNLVIDVGRFFRNLTKTGAWDEGEERALEHEAYYEGQEDAKRSMGKQPYVIMLFALAAVFLSLTALVVVSKIIGVL